VEPILVVVGFLGVGKTTLMKKLASYFIKENKSPYIIINDYENAALDAQKFSEFMDLKQIVAMNGSCICCSGVVELREKVNGIPRRENGITLIEANGTTDACDLMGFLAVGLDDRYLPPVQISIVDARLWQQRSHNNELEASQIQVSAMIVLNHAQGLSKVEIAKVKAQVLEFNPTATIIEWDELDIKMLPELTPSTNTPEKIDHKMAHWSACSVDLNDPMSSEGLLSILDELPKGIQRVKGCTRLDNDTYYSFFERTPAGETFVKRYTGNLITGPKLLVIGPGSEPKMLKSLVEQYG